MVNSSDSSSENKSSDQGAFTGQKSDESSHLTDQVSDMKESDGTTQESPVQQELGALQQEAERIQKEYLYLRAEFDNYKRNAIKERSDALKFGSERLLHEILGVLDNFERALALPITAENFESFAKGMDMTAKEFHSVVQRFGVSEITAEGEIFNPSLHEALGQEPSQEMEAGKVLRVVRRGYKLHDRILRPAQVIVASAPQGE